MDITDNITDAILVRYFKGLSPADEIMSVERWAKENDKNHQEFELTKKIMQQESNKAFKPNLEKALNRVMNELPDQRKKKGPIRGWMIAAAVIIVSVSISVLIFQQQDPSADVNYITHYFAPENQGKVELSEGSVVWLKEGSSLAIPENFDRKYRKARFNGEGYFEIVSDPENPFTIYAGVTTTTVLGTSFLLKTEKEQNKVSLFLDEGSVSFKPGKKITQRKIVMQPGEKLEYDGFSKHVQVSKHESMNHAAWKTGIVTFKNASISEIARDFSSVYNVRFAAIPENIRDITATFMVDNTKDFNEAIAVFQETTQLFIARKGEFYYIDSITRKED